VTNGVVERAAYWDGSPALAITEPNRIPIVATEKLAYFDEQPAKGNVFIRNDTMHQGVFDALHQAGIVGDVIRIVGRGNGELYECPLLV
jgi:DNA-binding LacI/PurR family transcriptional regulator